MLAASFIAEQLGARDATRTVARATATRCALKLPSSTFEPVRILTALDSCSLRLWMLTALASCSLRLWMFTALASCSLRL
eukprot:2427037-Pleurochrysis_carterae.AAC.1